MKWRHLILSAVFLVFSASLAIADEACRTAKTEEHKFPVAEIRSPLECNLEDANAFVMDKLISQAENERTDKCSSHTCKTAVPCTCNTRINDVEKISSKFRVISVRDKTCKKGVAYQVVLSPEKDEKFTSECMCVPKERETEKEKKDR